MKIFHNAKIYTLDKSKPTASAIVIDRGEIIAVGGDELLREFDRAEKEDLHGRAVLPGLTDSHLHLQYYSLGLQKIDCETDTLQECLRRVKARLQKAKPGEWILGHGWNQNVWGGWPELSALDQISPDNPVYLTAKSLHAGWANSAAMKLAGISASSPDPVNGQLQRDLRGALTGILLESAMELINRALPAPSIEEIASAIEKAQPILWKMGLTGVHDFDRRESFMALQQLHAQSRLKLRVTKNIPVELLDHAFELGLRTGFGDDWLRIGSVKAFMDGALGPRTAAMFQSYEGEPENKGILNMDGEQLFEYGR
ncbi:MAG: amidohydrolase family protein, partial [Chloroflexi bacterium]|nr:amidohydrolase family protein [Chloroflexota bacterium]